MHGTIPHYLIHILKYSKELQLPKMLACEKKEIMETYENEM